MSKSTAHKPCSHGLDPYDCPVCTDEMHSTHLADVLAREDPETHGAWMAEAEAWAGSMDAIRAEYGDLVPAPAPVVA